MLLIDNSLIVTEKVKEVTEEELIKWAMIDMSEIAVHNMKRIATLEKDMGLGISEFTDTIIYVEQLLEKVMLLKEWLMYGDNPEKSLGIALDHIGEVGEYQVVKIEKYL